MTKKFNLYKLNLSKKVVDFVIKTCKENNIQYKIGKRTNSDFLVTFPPNVGGYTFETYSGDVAIFMNDKQPIVAGHDLVLLHELGHALFLRGKYKMPKNQERYADGFALGMATLLGLHVSRAAVENLKRNAK